jgi:hypothetical protein
MQRVRRCYDEPIDMVLKKSKPLMRKDFGGRNAITTIMQKIHCTEAQAYQIKLLLDEQIDGCRKRVYPRIDDVVERIQLGCACARDRACVITPISVDIKMASETPCSCGINQIIANQC